MPKLNPQMKSSLLTWLPPGGLVLGIAVLMSTLIIDSVFGQAVQPLNSAQGFPPPQLPSALNGQPQIIPPQGFAPTAGRRINPNPSGQAFYGQAQNIKNQPELVRIKDITTIEGHRTNQLTGVGLVTGLKGTGGKGEFTEQIARNMLLNMDMRVDSIPLGSMSVVSVNAELPAFARPGEKIVAKISATDNAASLRGGILQVTALKGVDGQVYAMAAGELVLSGFSANGDAASVLQNHDTSGKVDAQVEFAIDDEPAFPDPYFRLLLTNKDYATAHRIANAVNHFFPNHAAARDQGSVDILFPREYVHDKFAFVVKVNELRVTPDAPARVVINQKTGTVVAGQHVKLSQVMFANENLIITTSETPVASQPAPLSQGETAVLPRSQVEAFTNGGNYNLVPQQTTVGELAGLLNTLGVSPRDMILIFQSIKSSGKLQAQLIIE